VTVLLALLTLLGGALQWLGERQAPYAPLRRLGFRDRTPFLALLAVTFLLAGLFNVQGGYHAMRVDGPSDTVAAPFDLARSFGRWLAQVSGACRVGGEYAAEDGEAVPLVMVAAPGGGIRAAYWTDRALHRLRAGTGCDDRLIFAASGVSGGSVGLMAHYLHVDDDPGRDPVTELSREGALAANVAAMAFRDLPAAVLGVSAGWADRGAVLEDAWAETDDAWEDTRLIRHLRPGRLPGGWRPLLLLNGTEVSTGCRLIVSPARVVASDSGGAPRSCLAAAVTEADHGLVEGAVDLHEFRDEQACDATSVQDGDLRAATAALLSARFPYVSPSAELFRCEDDGPRRAADLDGGAAENSALATVLDVWDALEPLVAEHNATVARCRAEAAVQPAADLEPRCGLDEPLVVPMLVLVDNHYASNVAAVPVGRQRELSAPAGLLSAGGVLATQAVLEQEALVTFSGSAPGLPRDGEAPVRYFRLAPSTRPGLAAPLGWTLSDLTRGDMLRQLQEAMAKPCEQGTDGMSRPAAPMCYRQAVGAA
jgi:hypothetical protein